MDGVLATSLIKETGLGVKVLMLSNHEDDARVSSAIKAGASGYVVKRVGMTDLVMIITSLVEGKLVVSPYLADMVLQERRKETRGVTAADFSLTDRELKVLGLLVRGFSNKEISNTIYISQDTVKVHLKHIFEKLEVDCRTKAAVKAIQHGIIPDAEAGTPTAGH
jgi:DNA-binding NarL/FixJ family response regulator